MRRKTTLGNRAWLILVAVALAGCATPPTAADYPALAARAEREIRRADQAGFLWLHTESYLAQSHEAYRAGDVDTARELAQRALDEALLAQQQALASKTVKPEFTHRH